jgi:alkanesulfonate monooxygenase SsuD/methylene tetrahydromethanopterin reductase-like flavin-dependent oxidoreductase (luciferase family)
VDAGFGRAFLPEEFDAFQRSMDESRARFEGGIEAVRRLWTESEVVYEDAFYRFGPITSSPRPVQQPHPPIFIAAVGTPSSFEWAGRQGFGMMIVPYISKFENLQANLERYRAAFAEAHPERPVPRVQMSYHLHVADSDAQAVAESREPMTQYVSLFRESASRWQGRSSADYPGYAEVIRELDTMSMERILAEGRAFIGSPDTVARQIQTAIDLFGDIEPSLSVLWGNLSLEESERSLRLFASSVMPGFQSQAGTRSVSVAGTEGSGLGASVGSTR